MKNVHLIATDKPSRLFYSDNNKELLLSKEAISFRTFERSPQNIYITSDEEIKEGDWFLHPFNTRHKAGKNLIDKDFKKIILTTDDQLIKDGVQAIDDEFLEWFVKNSSCEFVEVEKSFHWDNGVYEYEMTIPKEEAKQTDEKGNPLTYWGGLEKAKEETLEEYINTVVREVKDELAIDFIVGGIKLGAKWQQEQDKDIYLNGYVDGSKAQAKLMYSEEEVIKILYQFHYDLINSNIETKEEWFEQFKKK